MAGGKAFAWQSFRKETAVAGLLQSAVPGLLIALMESPTTMVYAGLVYLGVQQLESNVVTPLVMKKAVSLPPALTILATIVGGALFGVGGILLATPLAVTVMVLVRKVYVEGVLHKPVEDSSR